MEEMVCPVCHNPFVANYPGRVCCSAECAAERRGSFEQRFWARVNKKGRIVKVNLGHCHEWLGKLDWDGYARVKKTSHEWVRVHRASWEMSEGPIPDGLIVCHKCDVRHCVRRSHLFLGTMQDNAQDMLKKGRANKAQGSRHGLSKLTEKEARDILKKYATGKWTQQQLGELYGVGNMQVSRIVRGERWAHLQG